MSRSVSPLRTTRRSRGKWRSCLAQSLGRWATKLRPPVIAVRAMAVELATTAKKKHEPNECRARRRRGKSFAAACRACAPETRPRCKCIGGEACARTRKHKTSECLGFQQAGASRADACWACAPGVRQQCLCAGGDACSRSGGELAHQKLVESVSAMVGEPVADRFTA